ncbi:DUF4405 domain-containing protein [Vibrio campbellii]|uniref:DUF4405 domain-containing protein n=1 Tax=Vibrio campbellii TaxID=680 RepID=UPI00210EF9B1|nr:DUF4405 domain-containing protein [Vibrio campbellii]UTZ40182.1 DUF4405 domain-containing protein [Vibrio campbellii]
MSKRKKTTPLLIVTSLMVLVSGVMLFFDIMPQKVVLMHEWIGLILTLAVMSHVLMHKKLVLMNLKQGSNLVLMVCVLLLGSSMLQPEGGAGNPAENLFAAVDNSSIETIATLKGMSFEDIKAVMQTNHIQINNKNATITEVAQQNDISNEQLLTLIFR